MKITLALAALAAAGFMAQAQDNGGPPDGGPPDGGPPDGGPPGGGSSNGGPPPDGGFRRPPPLPLLLALDTNHDGIIDSNEIANASAELLTLDKNHDGQLTPDEYLPPPPPDADSSFRPPPSPLVKALDVNGDGIIDSNEIANASAELLTLDKNHDGQLTPDEYRPHRHHHGRNGPPNGDDSSNDGQHGPSPGDGNSPDGGPPGPPPGNAPNGDDSTNGMPSGPPPNQ